jgi:hypothetical protein
VLKREMMKRMRVRSLVVLAAAVVLTLFLSLYGFAESWKFVVTGDSRGSDNGVNTTILRELATEIVAHGADLVVFTGDLVTGGVNQQTLESEFRTWLSTMQPVYDAGIHVYPVRGNHDLGSPPGTTAWNNVFSGDYALPQNGPAGELNLTYSVAYENALFLGLDEYVTAHRVNQAWVDEQLQANTRPHVFVFGHEPAFKVYHADCLDDYPANRNAFWASLVGAGSRAYFCGHDHLYNHARVDDDGDPDNDVHQYVAGTAGAPHYTWAGLYDGDNDGYTVSKVFYASQYGYVLGEIDGLTATLTWMERTSPGAYEAKEVWTYTAPNPCKRTDAPSPEPYCSGPLFGEPAAGYPGWVWFSIPLDPGDCCGQDNCYDPVTLLGFNCGGKLWYWDKYLKSMQVYNPPFVKWDLAPGNSYLLRLESAVPNPAYMGIGPGSGFEFKLGRQGWTWVGKPQEGSLGYPDFMGGVQVQYPVGGATRTAAQDRASGSPWVNWGWSFWDTYGQSPRTFTPYAAFGNNTAYPWIGYRAYVNVGTATSESDTDQVTLIWP